jgi:hypothetical protein
MSEPVQAILGDSREVLIDDLAAGKAGEYLVCADLILQGHIAFPSEQGLPYDVVAEVDDTLYRIQVKTTRAYRAVPQRKTYTPSYIFHIKRCGKNGAKEYRPSAVDIFALVALDKRVVGYLPACSVKRTMLFRCRAQEGQYAEERLAERDKAICEMRATGTSVTAIMAEFGGMDRGQVYRICHGQSGRDTPQGRYIDECSFANALAVVRGGL